MKKTIFKSIARSVLPKAVVIAAIATCLAVVIFYLQQEGIMTLDMDGKVYTVFSSALAFLVVFRNGKAYSRWWDGVQALEKIKTDWLDACAQLCATTVTSRKSEEQVRAYCHTVTRMFSILSCIAFKHIADMKDERFEVLNTAGLDDETLKLLWGSPERPRHLIPLVEQWILNLVHKGMAEGIVAAPAPIVNRFFTGLHSGMVGVKKCYLISFTKFPLPYAIMVNALLMFHLFFTAAYAGSSQPTLLQCCPMVFIATFALWCINLIAMELEHPFGDDVNDINLHGEQCEINHHLLLLLDARSRHIPYCGNYQLLNGPEYRKHVYSTDIMNDKGNPDAANADGEGMRKSVFDKMADAREIQHEDHRPEFEVCIDPFEMPPVAPVVNPSELALQPGGLTGYSPNPALHGELRELVSQQHQQLAEGILEQLKQQGQTKDVLVRIQEKQIELLNEIAESCSRFFKESAEIGYSMSQAVYAQPGKSVEMSTCTPFAPFAALTGGGAATAPRRSGRVSTRMQ